MLSVENEMEQELVIALKDMKVIHLIRVADVDENVNITTSAQILLLVLEISVLTHVLELAEQKPFVQSPVMFLDVHVHQDSVEMLCSIVVKNLELHLLVLTPVYLHHVVLSHNAVKSITKEFAHVCLDTLVPHLIVVPNV
jgi:hypothetical protein